jgi:hypothetical protein
VRVGVVFVWRIYVYSMDWMSSVSGPRAWIDAMGMDSMRAFDVMHSSTRADACGRRGIDDDGWERETKTR